MKLTMAKKIWLITAAGLVVAGAILMTVAVSLADGDFGKLSTVTYETNTHSITEPFHSISVDADTEDVTLLPAEDGQCKVVCVEQPNLSHTVTVTEGVLTIRRVDRREWYHHIHIGWAMEKFKITVYLPAGDYEALNVKTDTGDVAVPKNFSFNRMDISTDTGDIENYASATGAMSITADTGDIRVENVYAGTVKLAVTTGHVTAKGVDCEGNLSVTVSTGDTKLTDVACQDLLSEGSTGDLTMQGVIAAGAFSVKRSTGDVWLDNCDAAELYVVTDTGSVTGTLLSDKVFLVTTDTGDIDVPKSVIGGRCEITTDTGDVRMSVVAAN